MCWDGLRPKDSRAQEKRIQENAWMRGHIMYIVHRCIENTWKRFHHDLINLLFSTSVLKYIFSLTLAVYVCVAFKSVVNCGPGVSVLLTVTLGGAAPHFSRLRGFEVCQGFGGSQSGGAGWRKCKVV